MKIYYNLISENMPNKYLDIEYLPIVFMKQIPFPMICINIYISNIRYINANYLFYFRTLKDAVLTQF